LIDNALRTSGRDTPMVARLPECGGFATAARVEPAQFIAWQVVAGLVRGVAEREQAYRRLMKAKRTLDSEACRMI